MTPEPVKLSELVATLSLVVRPRHGPADGAGAAPDGDRHAARRRRRASGPEVSAATYYTSLLTWVGCAADTSELAELFGDETDAVRRQPRRRPRRRAPWRCSSPATSGSGSSRLRRVGMVGTFLATAGRSVQQVMESHCQSTSELADRLEPRRRRAPAARCRPSSGGTGAGVPGAVGGDGSGPGDPARPPRRLHRGVPPHRRASRPRVEVATARRGTQFDPELVDCFCDHHDEILDGLDDDPGVGRGDRPRPAARRASSTTRPARRRARGARRLRRPQVAAAASATPAASPTWPARPPGTLGHADGRASPMLRAGRARPRRRHDRRAERGVGRDRAVDARPSRSGPAPTPTCRSGCSPASRRWPPVARCAAQHHERLDGSGYPHGLTGSAIAVPATGSWPRPTCTTWREPRPHRRLRGRRRGGGAARGGARRAPRRRGRERGPPAAGHRVPAGGAVELGAQRWTGCSRRRRRAGRCRPR